MDGSCLCGAVTFTTDAAPIGASVCHCRQCRKQSGHVWSSTQIPEDALAVTGPVKWFASSDSAKRGFCSDCGSFLFWTANDETLVSVSLGAIDGPTGVTLQKHIFVADKGDYYDIADGLPESP
jgi:hypothetical protein